MRSISIVLVTLILKGCQGNNLRVKVGEGEVEGHVVDAVSGKAVEFLGIPYAKPPVGSLRFMPPEPHDGWTGVLRAEKYSPACMQQDEQWALFEPMLGTNPTQGDRTLI